MFNVKRYLYKKRLTKKELAQLCGISQPTLRLIARGVPVSRKVAEKVSKATRCSIVSLVRP